MADADDVIVHVGKAPEKLQDYVRVVCVGETINENIDVPDGDVYIHTGNFTRAGDDTDVIKFINYLAALPHRYKVVVCGRRENRRCFELLTMYAESNCVVLDGGATMVAGLRIFGVSGSASPVRTRSFSSRVDIVVSCISPEGILDSATLRGDHGFRKNLEKYPPRVCVAGRGEGNGAMCVGETVYINPSIYAYTPGYSKFGRPVVFDIACSM